MAWPRVLAAALFLALAGAALPGGPAAAAPVGLGAGDAEGEYLAASAFGEARCTSWCLAVSGLGEARAGDCFLVCRGVAASGAGRAEAGLVAASAAGPGARGLYAAAGRGDAEGCRLAVSLGGDAAACSSTHCQPAPWSACGKNTALSAGGDARGDVAISVLGRAEGDAVQVSGCRLLGTCPPAPPPGPGPGPGGP